MRIGILTFHRATNYGAILQTYGLVSYLENCGYDVKVVDYKPYGMGMLYSPLNVSPLFRKLKRIVLNIYMLPSFLQRKKKRDMYWDYIKRILPLTNTVSTIDDLPDMDAFIVGSDQVWSTKFTGGVDKFYWGQFERKDARLISYAGSAAEDMNNSFYETDNVLLLNSFDSISVREFELKDYLQTNLSHKKITKVLDPTLLAGKSVFEKLINGEKVIDKSYILIYQVIREKDIEIQQFARKKAKELSCDIYEIINGRLYITSGCRRKSQKGFINPTTFVNLFKHAKYIITTSFHGTAFSLLFNRPFSVISVNSEVDSRAADILSELGLIEKLITLPITDLCKEDKIDWNDINYKLEMLRKPSMCFLEDALR